jgi:hypothetical protein
MLPVGRVHVGSQDGVDVLLLGQGGCELVDGVLAVDMEGDFYHPGFRKRAGLTGWAPVAEGLGGDVVDGEASRGGPARLV